MNQGRAMTNQLIQQATIEQIVEYRNRAIELKSEAFSIHAAGDAKDAESGVFMSLASYRATRQEIETNWSPPAVRTPEQVEGARVAFMATETARIDRGIWKHIIDTMDLEKLMDAQARKEFREEIAGDLPPLTVENIHATIEGFIAQADMIFMRGIAVAFSGLDRRFRSHDGFKIGNRIVLSYALTDSGQWNYRSNRDDTIRDIERTFCILDRKPIPDRSLGIIGLINAETSKTYAAKQFEIETEYFRVKGFKNGNVHMWFEDKALLRRVNRLLADYYGEAVGESPDVACPDEMGPGYHLTPAKNFGFFETSETAARNLFKLIGAESLSSLAGKMVLEPSAGRGAIADLARDLGGTVHCVEIQTGNAAVLREKRHQVTQADFLALDPLEWPKFDVIAMNPPFDNGRDCDHVSHALKFLAPGGVIVAIMSARAEFKDDARHRAFRLAIDRMDSVSRWFDGRKWSDMPAGSFAHAGTNINTVMVAARAPVKAEKESEA
jgi:predicted RNA methylase